MIPWDFYGAPDVVPPPDERPETPAKVESWPLKVAADNCVEALRDWTLGLGMPSMEKVRVLVAAYDLTVPLPPELKKVPDRLS